MENALVHNGSIEAKVQESLTANTAMPLGFIVPASLLNLLTCVVVPLFTVTTLNHWFLWLVRKVPMAVNANCFNFLGLWICPLLFKYWKGVSTLEGTMHLKKCGHISSRSKMHAGGSIPLQSAVQYARIHIHCKCLS